MARPTAFSINTNALLHNIKVIRNKAPNKQIIAMVKANAYGCGLEKVVQTLEYLVEGFGVACLEEALHIRKLGITTPCILFGGVFSEDELRLLAEQQFSCVVHQPHQLQWIVNNFLPNALKVWVKIDTGMHRLGFTPEEGYQVINALEACPWVDPNIILMTHFASADETNSNNAKQITLFNSLCSSTKPYLKSLANSAAIMSFPEAQGDIVRPGIMLYGVSPFSQQSGKELGLMPVMSFTSAISAINCYAQGEKVGYGGTWEASRPSRIAVVPAGYGDGYPRHINTEAYALVRNKQVPIVGRVSMDMLTIDITDLPLINVGDKVELWGENLPIERVAKFANTIGYELMCQSIVRIGCLKKVI